MPAHRKAIRLHLFALTGYFDLAADRRPPYFVYESYEVLTLFRAVPIYLNRFAKGADVMVVRYSFATGLDDPSPLRQHAMQRLVAGLNGLKRAGTTKKPGGGAARSV